MLGRMLGELITSGHKLTPRPTLLELTQPPRKRARESNGPFSSKRPRKAEEEDGDDEIEFTGGSNASGEELSESGELVNIREADIRRSTLSTLRCTHAHLRHQRPH